MRLTAALLLLVTTAAVHSDRTQSPTNVTSQPESRNPNAGSTGGSLPTERPTADGTVTECNDVTDQPQEHMTTDKQEVGLNETQEAEKEDNRDTIDILNELPFLETDPHHAIPYIAVLGLALCSGLFGNTLIIRTMIITKKVEVLGNEFILNLAVADLCVTCVSDPVCLLGVIKGKSWFMRYPWFCDLVACLCLSSCFCAFFNLSAVTLNRYLFVCHNQMYRRMFTHSRIVVMCVFIWIAAVALDVPNFLGWGDHFFDEKQLQCIWDRTASFSYTMLVTVGLIGIPILLMTLAYISIFCYIYRVKKNLFKHVGYTTASDLWKKQWMDVFKSSRTLLAVVIMYLICWTPYVFIVALDRKNQYPLWMHLWATFFAHMHSSLNWIIYAATSAEYRKGFMYALGCGSYKDSKSLYTVSSGSGTDKKTMKGSSTEKGYLPESLNETKSSLDGSIEESPTEEKGENLKKNIQQIEAALYHPNGKMQPPPLPAKRPKDFGLNDALKF